MIVELNTVQLKRDGTDLLRVSCRDEAMNNNLNTSHN